MELIRYRSLISVSDIVSVLGISPRHPLMCIPLITPSLRTLEMNRGNIHVCKLSVKLSLLLAALLYVEAARKTIGIP